MNVKWCLALVLSLATIPPVPDALAQLAVSANDSKVLLVNGRVTVVKDSPPDTVAIIDLKASPPRVIGEVAAPVSVVGPPLSVAITPDEGLALVTAAMKIDPADPTKQAPNNQLSVIDLKARPPRVIATLQTGKQPASVSIDRQGTLALVSNVAVVGSLAGAATGDHDSISLIDLTAKPPRVVDTIGVLGATAEGLKISPDSSVVAVVVHNGSNRPKDSPFYNDAGKLVMVRVTGKTLSRVTEAPIGHWSKGVAFSADSKTLLVGNMVEKDYWVFEWSGAALRDTGVRIAVKGGAAAIRTADK